jgi:hypothetical protein
MPVLQARIHEKICKILNVGVTLLLTVSQSVRLGVGKPFGAHERILLFPFFCRISALFFVLERPL